MSWVSRLEQLINQSRLEQVKMINSGIGGNVISPRSPSYADSGRPSAGERFEEYALDHDPDWVLVFYGLNDARDGTPLAQFLEDLRQLILEIKGETKAVMGS